MTSLRNWSVRLRDATVWQLCGSMIETGVAIAVHCNVRTGF